MRGDRRPSGSRGVAELCARRDLAPVALVVTHGHVDHIGGAGAVEEQLGVVTYVHPDDDFLSLHPLRQGHRSHGGGAAR